MFVQQPKHDGREHIELLSAKALEAELDAESDSHGAMYEHGWIPALIEVAREPC